MVTWNLRKQLPMIRTVVIPVEQQTVGKLALEGTPGAFRQSLGRVEKNE